MAIRVLANSYGAEIHEHHTVHEVKSPGTLENIETGGPMAKRSSAILVAVCLTYYGVPRPTNKSGVIEG